METPLKYTFKDWEWLANMAGFGVQSNVYYGTTLLGVIESRPTGYVILVVMGPHYPEPVQQGSSNMFKSKNIAADILHRVWARIRKAGYQRPIPKADPEEPETNV